MFASFLKQGKNYKYVGMMIFFIVLGIVFFGLKEEKQKASAAPIPVKIYTVGAGEAAAAPVYAGEIHSVYETKLAFQTGGKILSRKVKSGDHVQQGEVLAVLDTKEQEQTVRNMQAQASSALSQLKLAEKNMQRYRQLFTEGAVSEASYDQYMQQYEAAQATVEQSRAQAKQSLHQLGYGVLLADRDGVVARIKAEPGQVVTAGENVAVLADVNNLQIEFSVPENSMDAAAIGKLVQVRFSNNVKESYDAVIREVSPLADEETKTFQVKAQMQGDLSHVRLGMTARACMKSEEKDCSYIPMTAVFELPGQGKGVWLLRDGSVHFMRIETGRLAGEQAEVLSGLHQGDKIVAAGVQSLKEGQMVRGMEG